jgi:hypothetical protein
MYRTPITKRQIVINYLFAFLCPTAMWYLCFDTVLALALPLWWRLLVPGLTTLGASLIIFVTISDIKASHDQSVSK